MEKDNPNKNNENQAQRKDKPQKDKYPRKSQYNYRRQQPDFDKKSDSIISVVIPLYNEEESLPELALQLEGELKKVAKDRWEVIFIDDGSTDHSFSVLKQINDRNKKFRAIRLRRNYGKSAALSVGFAEAKGVIIVTMDADLQDDPAEIQNLLAKIKDGYDLVSGWKKKRKDPITKTIPSKFFNFVTSLASGIKLHDFNCGLKAYRREVVKNLQVYGEMHRYLPALAHLDGFKVTEVQVVHHPRRYGKSKFGFSRFAKGFLDLLTVMFTTRYLKRPMHFFGTFGILFAIIGLVIDGWLTVEWFLGKTALSNRPLAILGVALIIVGVQFVSLGLIGEMMAKNSNKDVIYGIKERL